MKTDFDQVTDRHNTGSLKWDFMQRFTGAEGDGLLPMWVSDYDFPSPPNVRAALHQRAEHGVFGYSERSREYYAAVTDWFLDRHRLIIQPEWICSCEGVVPGLSLLVQALSQPGEAVVVQGPYYGSFNKIISLNGRSLLENPLLPDAENGYVMDLAHLEAQFREYRPPLMILCNPHNPTGRCWSADELTQLMFLCEQYDVTVLSDEIWADLLLPGVRFTSVLSLGERWHPRVIAATSASKTFGLSSLRISNFLIPDKLLRETFSTRLDAHGMDVFNAMSMTAATTAYRYSGRWLDELLVYLAENRRWFEYQAREFLPWCRVIPSQATYLLWMDCRALGLDDDALREAIISEAGIVPSMGAGFGPSGTGFIRLNLGCPREYLLQAFSGLRRLKPVSL